MTAPPLRNLYVNPCGDCNLLCSHCWVSKGGMCGSFTARAPLENEFSADQFTSLLYRAVGLGLRMVKFTGGEPLLRLDFPSLYQSATDVLEDSIALTLETNGTVVPEGLWQVFDYRKPDLVSVSLDSENEEEHDTFRNSSGAWRRSVGFIRKLIDRGIPTQVIQCTMEPDRNRVVAMAGLCKKLGVSSLKVNPVQPIGRGTSVSVSNINLGSLIQFVNEVHHFCGLSVRVDFPPALLSIHRISSAGRCPILNLLGILPDGGISFCGIGFSCRKLIMGNFRSDDLEKVWNENPVLRKLRTEVPLMLEGICGNCIHRMSCKGKCVMQNYYSTGKFSSPYWICQKADELGLFPASRKIDPNA